MLSPRLSQDKKHAPLPEEVRRGVAELASALKRRAARGSSGGGSFLVCVDQEGGRVARLPPPAFTGVPEARALGAAGAPAAGAAGEVFARELRACHIDMDLAPVVEVDTNPANPVIGARAFSSDPAAAGESGAAFIAAMQGAGVAACAKHYPGHGDTSVDSHVDLPTVGHSMARMETVELPPFRRAIEAGVAAVLAAHVLAPAFDAGGKQGEGGGEARDAASEAASRSTPLPASMSAPIIGHLRSQLGFQGVVVTDDLEMGAITKHYTLERAVVEGLKAGVDLFLVCHTESKQRAAIEAIAAAVESGEVPEATLLAAVARVDALHAAFVEPAQPAEADGGGAGCGLWIVGSEENRKRIESVLGQKLAQR